MTTLGLKIDQWACETLAKFGVRTPLFSSVTPDGKIIDRQFAICHNCRRIFPHWWGVLTQAEQRKRGFIGCRCGGIRLDIAIIPGWKAGLWLAWGLVVRRLIQRKYNWDPRIPVRDRDLE